MRLAEMTPTQRALLILAVYGKTGPDDFAWRMWPLGAMHYRVSNQGHGATEGKAAWLCGGSFLRRLEKAGLAVSVRRYGYGYDFRAAGIHPALMDYSEAAQDLKEELEEADKIVPLRRIDYTLWGKAVRDFKEKHHKAYE